MNTDVPAMAASASLGQAADAAPQAGKFVSPLASSEQAEAERLIIRALANPAARRARLEARTRLKRHPLAQTPEGEGRLDHALDKWTVFLASQIISADTARPYPYWWVTNSEYSWFGHTFPGSGAAIDSPDNIYRSVTLEGDEQYVIKGQMRPLHPAQFSFQVVPLEGVIPDGGDLITLSILTNRSMDIRPDGSFEISVGPDAANGRPNHLQTRPGAMKVIIRDTLTNWRQNANELRVVSKGRMGELTLDEGSLATEIAGQLVATVESWLRFVDGYFHPQKDNVLIGPIGRTGSWGFMAPMRFNLADDEAIVITINDGAAEYASIQLCDVWMLAPDPQRHLSSYTTVQSEPNSDGSYTYIISKQDPGLGNWVDTAGWNRGWLQLRWQGLPATRKDGGGLVKSVRFLKMQDVPNATNQEGLAIPPEKRLFILESRATEWRLRVATGG